jgi:hypothetical protein
MQDTQSLPSSAIPCGSSAVVHCKLQRICAVALSALERRLQEQRLPIEEQAFLSARLAAYRKAAVLELRTDSRSATCTA